MQLTRTGGPPSTFTFFSIAITPHSFFFFFNDTATPEIYPLPLHAALPISGDRGPVAEHAAPPGQELRPVGVIIVGLLQLGGVGQEAADAVPGQEPAAQPSPLGELAHRHRSEEHTSELQSLAYLVCRLLLEK